MKQLLFTPGPVPLPDEVYAALLRPMIAHKSEEFKEIFSLLSENLKKIFLTEQPVMTLTCSGTGAAEAAICNTLSAGDKALVLVNGRFAKRWSEMLSVFGIEVTELNFEWGEKISPDEVEHFLRKNSGFKSVWMTHSETSTGILNDIEKISSIVHENSDALVCVDAISSLGAHEFFFDEWKLDVVISAPQKALISSPGLGFVALSENAWKSSEKSTLPKFYFDLKRARKEMENGTTPWTPAIQEIQAQLVASELIINYGLEKYWNLQNNISRRVKEKISSLGLKIFGKEKFFAQEKSFSRTVTAVETSHAEEILLRMKKEFGVEFASGQDHLQGKIFRFGHAGFVGQSDLNYVFESLETILNS